ncbi:MAG TPA: beta-ketoacyl-[acyl-carrier-protein] synthase family protein [Kiritimatiellia bacterium]|nr:beta-ketoacyl-[acyl-carrier-protein] synthase family protein [Kiritimatiellia bacterium]HRZ11367.1 beta-ketoacyl-[acyl-carrier-protein] synthase family protein [Kiritimatiellia bacterium]HSA17082.1 beta-ketoacyl-[acyl-carrier-protein] synthase family protein [Kiritimatiellia bacterium]
MEKRRVVVTGMGMVTPLGLDESSVCARLFGGQGGIRRITSFDPATFKSKNGAEIDPEALAAALTAFELKPSDRATDMALAASGHALKQAGLLPAGPGTPGEDTAVLIGSGSGPSHAVTESWKAYAAQGARGVRPTTVPRCMLNVLSSQVSIRFGLKGPNYVLVAACSSSTMALGIGYRMILHGYARRVLCGGSDSMFTAPLYTGWDNLGVMSRSPDPDKACRPFDAGRDGFVLGEGAGAVVLESLEEARSRGARIRAEIHGYGETSDATHITRPSVEGQAAAMTAALRSAQMAPGDIDFVNAHGTATKANDVCEAEAIRGVFGSEADRVFVVSSKSFFGHLLGAAGIVETLSAILCLEAGRLHANLNLDQPDPMCNVRLVGRESQAIPLRTCMKNSFGFGGGNAVMILGQYKE